jgi:DNA adenine methylase
VRTRIQDVRQGAIPFPAPSLVGSDEAADAVPHPIPYQGSKRALAGRILSVTQGLQVDRLHEPFAGSAAITIAAARLGLARKFSINDSLAPLSALWKCIVQSPAATADAYEQIWRGQTAKDEGYFSQVRDAFNRDGDPAKLLYLLARCVKNAPRFNRDGGFNQSADKRRLGMRPEKMRRQVEGAAALLRGRTRILNDDFEAVLDKVAPDDLVYLDPPWQGTSLGPHKRYHQGLTRERLLSVLERLNAANVSFLLSYDGRCGDRTYGEPLPAALGLTLIELQAGRSSQSTLAGRTEVTVESLYVSPALRARLPAGRRVQV